MTERNHKSILLNYYVVYATSSTTLDTTLTFSNVVHYVRHPKWNYFISKVSYVVIVIRICILKCVFKQCICNKYCVSVFYYFYLKKKKKNLHRVRDSNSLPQRYLIPWCAPLSMSPRGILTSEEIESLLNSLIY